MRNIEKKIALGNEIIKKRRRLDLTVKEEDELINRFYDRAFKDVEKGQSAHWAVVEMIYTSYKLGLAVGIKNA